MRLLHVLLAQNFVSPSAETLMNRYILHFWVINWWRQLAGWNKKYYRKYKPQILQFLATSVGRKKKSFHIDYRYNFSYWMKILPAAVHKLVKITLYKWLSRMERNKYKTIQQSRKLIVQILLVACQLSRCQLLAAAVRRANCLLFASSLQNTR